MKLLFLTTNFPFGRGEAFIESEIEILAAKFEEIYILPSRRLWSRCKPEEARALPPNVKVALPWAYGFSFYLRLMINARTMLQAFLASLFRYDFRFSSFSLKACIEAVKDLLKLSVITGYTVHYQKKYRTDVAYAYWKAEIAYSVAFLKEKNLVKCAVARAHRYDLYPFAWYRGYNPFDRYVMQHIDAVYSISLDGVKVMQEIGYPSEKLDVSRLGVRQAEVCSQPSDDGIVRILTVSRLEPIKRVHLLVEAFKLLPRDKQIQWTHLGNGSLLEPTRIAITDLPENLSVNLPGEVSNSDVLAFFRNNPVDLFINVSESEGVPVSIMEALSHGVPCIATDTGGTAEIVTSENGILLNVDCNADDIARAILDLSAKCAVSGATRQAAVNVWESLCNRNANYEEFVKSLTRKLA